MVILKTYYLFTGSQGTFTWLLLTGRVEATGRSGFPNRLGKLAHVMNLFDNESEQWLTENICQLELCSSNRSVQKNKWEKNSDVMKHLFLLSPK